MASRNQVTCECTAYDFPHRIGGGRCTGSGWCDSYRCLDQTLCDDCNCFSNGICQVTTGQEDFKEGECYQIELRLHWMHGEYGNLPIDFEEHMKKHHRNYYEQR